MTMQHKHRSEHATADRGAAARSFRSPACSLHELEMEHTPRRARDVRIKRIYDKPARSDGFRILVDRIWPRGVTKQQVSLDAWGRALAPSTALRKWFGHDPKRWSRFRERYRAELREHAVELDALRRRAARQRVTLLYAARDSRINHAVVIEELVREA